MPESLRFSVALWIVLGTVVATTGYGLLVRFRVVRAPAAVDHFVRGFGGNVALIAFLGLAWRIGFAIVARRGQDLKLSDSAYYLHQGTLLADGKWFVEPFLAKSTPSIIAPGAAHPPLYPSYFGFWALFGLESPLEARITSSFLGVAAVVVIGYLVRRLAGSRAGLIAALITAVYGNLWLNDVMIAAESAFALMIAWVLLASYRLWERPTTARAVHLGVAIAFAALTRAEALLFFVLIPVPLLLWRHWRTLWPRARSAIICGVVGGLILAPWALWNLSRFEEPTLLSVGAGYTMMLGNCDATYDPDTDVAGYWSYECDPWINADDPRGPGPEREGVHDQSVLEVYHREKALEYIRAHRSELPLTYAMRVGRLFGFFKVQENLKHDRVIERRGRWPAQIALWQYYCLFAFSGLGAWTLHRRRIPLSPLIAMFLVVLVAMIFAFGITRYRLPVDVVLVVLGAVGIDQVVRWIRGEPDPDVPRPHAEEPAKVVRP